MGLIASSLAAHERSSLSSRSVSRGGKGDGSKGVRRDQIGSLELFPIVGNVDGFPPLAEGSCRGGVHLLGGPCCGASIAGEERNRKLIPDVARGGPEEIFRKAITAKSRRENLAKKKADAKIHHIHLKPDLHFCGTWVISTLKDSGPVRLKSGNPHLQARRNAKGVPKGCPLGSGKEGAAASKIRVRVVSNDGTLESEDGY